jgi:hypothetical protein
LEDEEFALRSLQKSKINNRHSSINLPFAAGKAKPLTIHRAKIRPAPPLPAYCGGYGLLPGGFSASIRQLPPAAGQAARRFPLPPIQFRKP